ncbi:MAG: lysine biosynthesis protein LysW [Chloroflexi bacterium]|nr:MAG: lysine biosynthesis protein LysW [Chloroflexota bacterium]
MAELVKKVHVARCPACGVKINFNKPPFLDQAVTCPECETELQVYQLNPLKLDWTFDDYCDDYEE